MAQTIINISSPNDGLGDTLRGSFDLQNQMNTELYNTKVDKVLGKELSSNDYTTTEKTKLSGIAPFAEVNVQADWLQEDDTQDDYIKNKNSIQKYKVYTALLSQDSVSNPTVEILENTIGDIVWTRADIGIYRALLENSFIDGKCFFIITQNRLSSDNIYMNNFVVNSIDDLYFYNYKVIAGYGDGLKQIHIEIRVYP